MNRFERKKNLPLAVEALAFALEEVGAEEASRRGLRLVVAGELRRRFDFSLALLGLFWL